MVKQNIICLAIAVFMQFYRGCFYVLGDKLVPLALSWLISGHDDCESD